LSNNNSMETEYLTVEQVAKVLNVHPDTVRNRFGKEPGVIDLSADRKVRRGRRHSDPTHPAWCGQPLPA